ncbi:MAG: serine hydrolase domain-containing protein, partial [bacterium]
MKRKIKWILLILVLVVLIIWLVNSRPRFSPEIDSRLDDFMSVSMKKYDSPGMILGVWIPGKGSFVRSKGLADVKEKIGMNPHYRYRIGSLTKTFTATIILQLIDEGKLNLDDKLSKFYSNIPNAGNITIEQLLNMTSGLHSYTEIESIQEKIFSNRFVQLNPEELIMAGVMHKPDFPPGKGYHYSNTNYVILGRII